MPPTCSAADQEERRRDGEDLEGWRRWTEMTKQRRQGKHEQQRFQARWGLYFCPLACCQVNANELFYRWDYSCWHFQCTSYTSSSSSSSWLLILYAVSPRELSRTLSGGVQVRLNNEKQRSWLQTHALHGVDTIIVSPLERKLAKNQWRPVGYSAWCFPSGRVRLWVAVERLLTILIEADAV